MTRTLQHRFELGAAALLYLTFAVSLVADWLLGQGYFAPHKSTSQYLMLYGAMPLLLVIYYCIGKGMRGAKTTFLTLYAFVLLDFMTGGLLPAHYDTRPKLVNLVVQHGLQVVASVLILVSLRKDLPTKLA